MPLRQFSPCNAGAIHRGRTGQVSFRLSWTFNEFVFGNVSAFQPQLEGSSAERADRVTRVRYQELLFSASVLGAAIALHNCRHLGEYALRTVNFPVRKLSDLPR